MISCTGVYMRMIVPGAKMVKSVNAEARHSTSRSMMVTAFFSEFNSRMPQYRDVSTDAPIPMPIQKI